MSSNERIPVSVLQSLLAYDPATGVITRRDTGNAVYHEQAAGGPRMEVCGRRYDSRRMAWALHSGEWPPPRKLKTRGSRFDLRLANLLLVPDGEQFCPDCQQTKPLEEFIRASQRKSKRGTYCKPCAKRRWERAKNAQTDRNIAKKYGISVDEYRAMVEASGGKCRICGSKQNGKRLALDHCHATQAVRGLLCSHCNTGLGHFRDDPRLILRAAQYLLGKLPDPN